MATVSQLRTRKARTIHPYHRAADGWYYAVAERFRVPFGTNRIKLIRAEKTPENEQLAIVELRRVLDSLEAEAKGDDIRLDLLVDKYLQYLEQSGCTATHFAKSKMLLLDFCKYHGALTVAQFATTAAYKLDQWIAANSKAGAGAYSWDTSNSKFRALVCIKSLFNYGASRLNITNPIRGKAYSLPKATPRVTWFDDDQEEAILDALKGKFRDKGEFADVFSALIATGARTFVELGRFTRDRVLFNQAGQPIAFDMGEVKRKQRVIYLTPAMSAVVAKLIVRYPTGPLFRNSKGGNWYAGLANTRLKTVLRHLIEKRPELGLTLDHCLYSCRHTFAVRMLEKTNGDISRVADLMGNTVATVQKYYAKWGIHRRECLAALGWESNQTAPTTPAPKAPNQPALHVVGLAG